MGNCFSSQRGTTGKLNDPTHGTGLTSLHSMQGGPLVGVGPDPGPGNVLDALQRGPITTDVGVRSGGPLDPSNGHVLGHQGLTHQLSGLDHRPLPDPGGDGVLGLAHDAGGRGTSRLPSRLGNTQQVS